MHKQKMGNNVGALADKIREFHSKDELEIEFYTSIFNKLSEKKLLDTNFLSYISNKDSCVQRLSELLLTEYCLSSIEDLNPSKDFGPDITFNYQNKTVNIEIVTPIKVQQKEAIERVFSPVSFNNFISRDTNTTKIISVPDKESLHPRITSVCKDKCEKFNKYIPQVVKSDDINIICINLGFIENYTYIGFAYLKNLFIKQEIIRIELDEGNQVSHDIAEENFWVRKSEDVIFPSSYLDNNKIFDSIDAVWIIAANEDSFHKIKLKQFYDEEKAKNMIYTRNQTTLFKELISTLSINPYESDYFINYIRENKKLPD